MNKIGKNLKWSQILLSTTFKPIFFKYLLQRATLSTLIQRKNNAKWMTFHFYLTLRVCLSEGEILMIEKLVFALQI